MKRNLLSWLLGILPFVVFAQVEKPKNYSISAYVKNLQTVSGLNIFDEYIWYFDNLIHNRININYYPASHWKVNVELRNRVFMGDQLRLIDPTSYEFNLDQANAFFDLSIEKASNKGFAFQSMIDRAYLEWSKNDWEIRLGRQRINWGISTFWNPNDIYNAYSFTDFDYEERPGTDALRIKYYTGFASSVEVAVNVADTVSEFAAAALWKWNKWNYDFQWMAGYAYEDIVFGGGWTGNIKNLGFKGEWSYFLPTIETGRQGFAASFGFDYISVKSWMWNIGYLYNQLGVSKGSITELVSFNLSAKNLYPYKHTGFLQTGYPIGPLVNLSLAIIYSPVDSHPIFLNPSVTWNFGQSWDLDFISQVGFSDSVSGYDLPFAAFFLRIKKSI